MPEAFFVEYELAIPAGQTRDAIIQLPIKNLAVTGLDMEQTIENGNYERLIGTSSTDIRTRSVITVGDVHTIEEKGAIELVKVTPDGDTIR